LKFVLQSDLAFVHIAAGIKTSHLYTDFQKITHREK